MKSYSSTLHSEGHSYVKMEENETRPAFLVPGEVSLAVTFENPQGQSLTLQPAQFDAKPGHHYNIKLDVNGGEVGVAVLSVIFDDELTAETVNIDLTPELFTAPGPKVNLDGIDAVEGVTPELEFLAGEAPDGKYKFNVLSYGGLKEVKLTLNVLEGDGALARELNLISASEEAQAELKALGIDCKGIFKNPDKMAQIDFSKLPALLPAGNYEVSVVATDLLTRQSDPVTVKINSVKPNLHVTPVSAIYGLNTGTVSVEYNGSHPEDDITFKAMNKWGEFVDAPIIPGMMKSIKKKLIEDKQYSITISLPEFGDRQEVPVKVYLFGEEKAEVKLPVEFPEYEVKADGFARKVKIKVEPKNTNLVPVITENLHVYNGGSEIKGSAISRDTDNGIITITGLTQQNTYAYTVSLVDANTQTKDVNFTTEEERQIENGGFDNIEETISIMNINAGGEYKSLLWSQTFNTSDIIVSTPTGWANLNPITCYTNASIKNTWCMVPSTYMNDGAVVVRSVAYSHDGPIPELDDHSRTTYYYSQKAPSSFGAYSSGELFLGTFSFDGSIQRTDGIEFSSRPESLTFQYSYVPYGSEVGEVTIKLIDDGDNIIASKTEDLISQSSMTSKTVSLPSYSFGKKAARIQISFKSTKGNVDVKIPTGTDLNDTSNRDNGTSASPPIGRGYHIKSNLYKALATGSVLTIDNVKLNY